MTAPRVCVAGAGRAFQRLYLPAFGQVPALQLAAVADPDPERLQSLPGTVAAFPSLEAGLNAGAFEGVLIASPPATHASLMALATERGIPVLVEKPMALSMPEVAGLAEQQRALVTPAFPRRLWPTYQRLRTEPMAQGDLVLTLITDPAAWGPGAGAVELEYDVLPHLADVACWLRGSPPVSVSAHGYGDGIEVELAWTGAAPVHCRVRHGRYQEHARTLGGRMRLGGSPLPIALWTRVTRQPPRDVVAVTEMLRRWARRLAGDPAVELPGFVDGAVSVSVVDAARDSLTSGAPVAPAKV